jgi:hypothetical protein
MAASFIFIELPSFHTLQYNGDTLVKIRASPGGLVKYLALYHELRVALHEPGPNTMSAEMVALGRRTNTASTRWEYWLTSSASQLTDTGVHVERQMLMDHYMFNGGNDDQ